MPDTNSGQLADTIKHITSRLTVDNERLKATFSFVPPASCDTDILAVAFEKILFQYFKIIVSADQLSQIKAGQPLQFLDESVIGLPGRTVSALLRPKNCLLKIEGQKAVDGRNGYSDVFFPWKKEAGQVDEQGNIDLKRTNALAGMNKGDLLATIFCKTTGQPGISFDGRTIKPQKGLGDKVKWNAKTISKFDHPGDSDAFQLIANISGLIASTFLKRGDPRTLNTLDIQESVIINGDVNYGIGNQGKIDGKGSDCAFSLDIKGNVKGAFSLQSNGYIHVSGTIEGQSVTAREITAELITGGCLTNATEAIYTKGIVNATAQAPLITISLNASGSNLRAESVVLNQNANFVGMTVETHRLESNANNFSGRNKITFSPHLFEEFKKTSKEIRAIEQQTKQASIPNKEIATAMLTDISRIEEITSNKQTPLRDNIAALIVDLKLPIINAIQAAGKLIDTGMIQLCYTLQATLGEARFDDSLLRKVESLITHIQKYNVTAQEIAVILEGYQEKKNLQATIEAEIRNNLCLTFQSPKMIGQNSRLNIHCQDIEETFTQEDFKGNRIEIRYIAPSKDKEISKGKIVLSGTL